MNRHFYEEKYKRGEEIQRSSKIYTLEYIPKNSNLKVLDIGCGSGLNSKQIRALGHSVIGVDISKEAIRKYVQHGFLGCQMDLEKGLGFEAEQFDIVFCSEVIEHLVNYEILMKEIYRILRFGGRLILSTPNSAFWIYRFAGLFGFPPSEIQHPKHIVFFSKRSLRQLLIRSGLEPIKETGRNIFFVLPDPQLPALRRLFSAFGFRKETRFRTMSSFYHLSNHSSFLNGLFADTLIVVGQKLVH